MAARQLGPVAAASGVASAASASAGNGRHTTHRLPVATVSMDGRDMVRLVAVATASANTSVADRVRRKARGGVRV